MANLATLDEFKTYSGVKNPENDDRTEAILASVSSLIKAYCGRTFVDYTNDDKEEFFDGGQTYIYPNEFPLLNISTVEYSTDMGTTYTALDSGTGFVLDRKNDRIYVPGAASFSQVNGIRVEYTGGYLTVPRDLQLAVFDLTLMYMKAETPAKRTQGFTSVEFITSADFPSHIKRVLDLYRIL